MDTEVKLSSSPGAAAHASTAPANLAAKQGDSRKSTSTTPAFLSNLGRATLRGIRKCPQCGVYNGTRGLSCKNKACGISLRNASAASKSSAVEVVKVIIDSEEREGKEGVLVGGAGGGVQVFSVCHRGRGATATQLGFVELVPTDTAIATGDGTTLLTRINLGRCFLPSCRQGHKSNQGEAEAAGGGGSGGGGGGSKQSSDSLCVHIKQAIECRSRATPLTLKSSVLEGLQASVQAREELWALATESPGPLVQRVAKDTLVVKCHTDSQHPLGLLHLTVGADGLLEASKSGRRSREQQQPQGVFQCACQGGGGGRRSKAGVEGSASAPASLTPQPCLHFYACVCAFASDEKLASEFAAFISYNPSGVQPTSTSRGPSEKPLQQVVPLNSHHQPKKLRLCESLSGVDERTVVMGFPQWLAGVTERIHQTMHYQFDGKPQPLVYHIPQEFFNALQQRLSLSSKKKRLPNFTTAFVSGCFSKYTWHITDIMQVKRIFDTPELPLELSHSFVKNANGSYSRFRCPEPPPEPQLQDGIKTERPLAIRPMELRTFLKVGPGSADQKEASPFVIEWIPDVLPRCQMGELRLSFEFGHQQSGQPESSPEKGGRNRETVYSAGCFLMLGAERHSRGRETQ
uniref:Putative treble-clef zinc-finger domain-containing protein n=1 Tax=Dicentrarchus labrax TaxID=13489 RepID=A0A8P4G2U2_DICLA